MTDAYEQINNFLVTVFNEVLQTEEANLKTNKTHDLSIREMHIIEAVCNAEKSNNNTSSSIANSQRITAGTLTTTINTLEKKGYVFRKQDSHDKRVIRIYPTEKGKNANDIHSSFHHKMVSSIMSSMNSEELSMFVKGLSAIQKFLKNKQQNGIDKRGKFMTIKIITDSTCDIDTNRQEELGIKIVPLTIKFGNKEYIDGETLSKPEFYKLLENCDELPTTAQINPKTFEKIFSDCIDNGEEVIGIFLSSKLSGTFQSAIIAKNLVGSENIHLIDSKSVTFPLGLLVLEAVKMRDAGKSAHEICKKIDELKNKLRFYAVLDSLKYLKMGGRLSPTSAFFGSVLQIKPIVSIEDGEVVAVDKKKGLRAATECIAKKVEQDIPDTSHIIAFGDADAPNLLQMIKDNVRNSININNYEQMQVGAVVGTYAGLGCAGIAYIKK